MEEKWKWGKGRGKESGKEGEREGKKRGGKGRERKGKWKREGEREGGKEGRKKEKRREERLSTNSKPEITLWLSTGQGVLPPRIGFPSTCLPSSPTWAPSLTHTSRRRQPAVTG